MTELRFRHAPDDFIPPGLASVGTAFVIRRRERGSLLRRRLMFENNQKEIESLMSGNEEFRTLYQRHKELDKKVLDAELGVSPLDDLSLAKMKKEKLWAKDRLTHLYEHQRTAAG
jgi:uncharacterized protein YdcH (DUF465 family)